MIGRYAVCRQYDGALTAGASVSLHCDTARSAKYVIVQLPTTDELSFADVQVCAKGAFILRLTGGDLGLDVSVSKPSRESRPINIFSLSPSQKKYFTHIVATFKLS